MTPEYQEEFKNKAIATFLRQDGVQADEAEIVEFAGYVKIDPRYKGGSYTDSRYAGNYVLLRKDGELVAVYKQNVTFGPARAVRTESGGVAYQVNSMSVGVKRVKRIPKGLVE
jgi:hypothetical protein